VSEILPSAGKVIYEVELEADAAIEAPFDTWLRDHIADVLQFPGFLSAEILTDTSPVPGRIRRTVQYRLSDRESLDQYRRDHETRMHATGIARFGGQATERPRAMAQREEFIRGAVSTENCLNCGEVLTGQHCSHCGQRAKVRVLSLWGLLRDVFGDLTNFDSRLWRTLLPLAFRPGVLTQDFLRGKRASYTPPFRMYLILSVAFFLIAQLGNDPGSALRFNVDEQGGANLQFDAGSAGTEPATDGTSAAPAQRETSPAGTQPATSNAAAGKSPARPLSAEEKQLVDAIVKRLPEKERERARREMESDMAMATPEDIAAVRKVLKDPCGEDTLKVDIGPAGEKYESRLRDACRKIVADTPSFGRALFENIPKMMFLFLPLIAVVLHVLYLGSGRYYVEHLLFVVHYHAFFFLGGLSILLLERLSTWADGTAIAGVVRAAEGVVTVAFLLYIPVYLYRAMRRVYGQGHLLTLTKYSILGIAYLFSLVITGLGLLFYTALTL
jgi:hypothetical protein